MRVRIIFVKLLIVMLFSFTSTCNAEYPKTMDDAHSKPVKLSDIKIEKIINILKEEAPEKYYNGDLTVTKFGTVKNLNNQYHLIITALVWGNKRMTKRLVVFSDKWHYLGNYYLNEKPIKIENDTVYFPFDKEVGNVIKFSPDPPKQAYLGGELVDFDIKKAK